MDVVEREEAVREQLVRHEQVAQIGAGEAAARVARALRVQRRPILHVAGLLEREGPVAGEALAVARIARRQHAVEHVHAAGDRLHEVLGLADAHEVARLRGGQEARDQLGEVVHLGLGLADRQAADRVAVEPQRRRRAHGAAAEVLVGPALDDPEERLARSIAVGRLRARRPAERELERPLRSLVRRRVRQAFVEWMDDVGAQRLLDLDRELGRQEMGRAVDGRPELDAVLGDPTELRETPHLEAAGVRQECAVPAHEAMESAERPDQLVSRTEEQVVGVREHEPSARGSEVVGCQGLDGAARADRHEDGSLDHAVGGREATAARGTVGRHDLERHGRSRRDGAAVSASGETCLTGSAWRHRTSRNGTRLGPHARTTSRSARGPRTP